MKRVIVVHGWGGNPEGDWMPWIKKALSEKGFKVLVPEMPDTNNPKIGPWVTKLGETIHKLRSDDILIGHSIGTLTIINYLKSLKNGNKAEKAGKVILVAPWHFLTLGEDEDPKIAEPWINESVDWEKVRNSAIKFIAVFSKDDPWVPYKENKKYFEENLNPEIIVKDGFGHFTADEGHKELPFILELI